MIKRVVWILWMVILVLSMVGCGGSKPATTTTSINIVAAGSSTITPILEEIARVYMEKNEDIGIEVKSTSSSEGIKAINSGSVDIGMSSRVLKEEEKTEGLTEHTIAYDGLVVIVNPKNTILNLSTQELKDIYEGKIKNWKDVGGKDSLIKVVTREEGQGIKSTFEEVLLLQKDGEKEGKKVKVSTVTSDAMVIGDNDKLRTYISEEENGIGYITLGYIDQSIKALNIDGIMPSVNNIKGRKYKLARPLLLLTKGEDKQDVEDFLDFVMTEDGQKAVSKYNYITVRKSRK